MIITVSELKGDELIKNIQDGIVRKLQSSSQLVQFDKEIAAGLYTYALEEFGKLLLVKGSKLPNNLYEINNDWFKTHKDKFPKAFDYLQENNHGQCIELTEGDFAFNDFYWRDFMIGLTADFAARLTIFYSDFIPNSNNDIDVMEIPDVDRNILQSAIVELEKAIRELA